LGSEKPARSTTAKKKVPVEQTLGEEQQANELAMARQRELTSRGIIAAFQAAHDGYSADRVVIDPDLNAAFLSRCEASGLAGDPRSWNSLLFGLRKSGQLTHIETRRRTSIEWSDCDAYLFASEIALRLMLDDSQAASLDEILCDPELGVEFDAIAARFAPGYSPLQYRWAALKLRKEANNARTRGAQLKFPKARFERERVPLKTAEENQLPAERGVYLLSDESGERLYAGETLSLRDRLRHHRSNAGLKELAKHSHVSMDAIHVQAVPLPSTTASMLAWQSCLLTRSKGARLNYAELWSA
jgi:site-specific DNA-methyltransferase (adenine-specific)